MNEETRRAIVAEIVAASKPQTKQPWQFDAGDYVAQCPELTHRQAYEILNRMATRGDLQTALVSSNGQQVRVFWRSGDEGKE